MAISARATGIPPHRPRSGALRGLHQPPPGHSVGRIGGLLSGDLLVTPSIRWMSDDLSAASVEQAAARLAPIVRRTPLEISERGAAHDGRQTGRGLLYCCGAQVIGHPTD